MLGVLGAARAWWTKTWHNGLYLLGTLVAATVALAAAPCCAFRRWHSPGRSSIAGAPGVTGWGAALSLGLMILVFLATLAAISLPLLARAHARCCLAVLAPSPAEQLVERVTELTRTRTDVLRAHRVELRRIERDLHEGTRARLVAIAMRPVVACESFSDDPDAAAVLVRQAHVETEDTMTELRSVIRTIYPPVLADQGLSGALGTLATGAGVPTRIDIGPLGEFLAAVEAVACFAVSEALEPEGSMS
ncbi:sensor histidine kinase [Streptomyces sp. NPDC097727]|uniref:sensor histidine kinase n=1 Tax=Streptomyces sp. NPDC097727 TaxID=3366092 RepID=UPI0037F29030